MNLSKTCNFIAKWIKEYSKKHGNKTLVVGVSGGIDSALTSTLCAISGVKTLLVSIPIHQRTQEVNNATTHMEWLEKDYSNIETMNIELTNLFEEYVSTIPLKYQCELGFANSRARLRMTILYQMATKENGLVVGTGNKIEDFGIGFFTKYGDGGVDISPIADLTKSEVKELARFCQVDKKIMEADPTDGLWEDGRTDEIQIGATYKDLEWAMDFNGNRKTNDKEQRILEIYKKFNAQNKHKMSPIPICKIPTILRG